MKVYLYIEENERYSNIGLAKALIELNERFGVNDLREIAQYLLVFVENNSTN